MALAKVPGRAKRLPNALVSMSFFPEKRGLWSFLGLEFFRLYRGIDTVTEMLIGAKDHGRAQAACA